MSALETAGSDDELADAIAQFVELQRSGRAPSIAEFARGCGRIESQLRACLEVLVRIPGGALELPRHLGGFRLSAVIGRGGMGVVYRAEQEHPSRVVALKVLAPFASDESEYRARFRREIDATARLRHPNLVPVLEAGEVDGLPYYAMPLLEGESLDRTIARMRADRALSPLADRRALVAWVARFVEVARALDVAHRSGVVHRDIKPSNLFLESDARLVVLDFGLTRSDADGTSLTARPVGTPRYMSPEQILGQRAVDGRSDQFALAATLYELLALEPAFAGDERESVFHAILSVDPTPPRELDPRVPRDLEVVVLHALEKEPRRRYASCAELADDLQRFLDYEPLRARPVRWPGRIARRARRNPVAAAAIAVAALAVVAAPFGAALHARERTRETAGAELAAARADRGRLSELRAALNRSQRELASREEHAEPGAPRAEREALRNARREVARLGREVETAFRESLGHASTALRIDPRCGAGREIAAAAFGELLDAERSRDRQRAADLRSLLLTYDDGELAPLLDARGSVSIATSNGSARAHLFRCVDQDELRVAVPAAARDGAIDREALASFDARGPWVWLRIDGVEPANFGLAAGDEITSVCGEPPVDGAAIAAHLSAPHAADPPSEHVIEFLRSGEPLSASFAPCTTLALSGERTSRPAFPLRCDAFNDLGETPIRELSLAMGSYLIVLGAGEREVRVPFEVRRSAETLAGEHVELSVDLARAALLGDEFVYVAGGRAALGGDQRALATLPLHDAEVEPFYVQRREVTFGEYFEFLHWLDRCDPRAAEERAPRQGAARTRQWMPLWKRADKSWPIEPALPPGVGLDWPLVCISFGDAEAYCQWRNEVGGRDDLEFALPTEGEWEKAARGVDSRTFAWGDGFDWTLARLGKTWHVSGLARGELFATDESIYGVRDMNGSVREWCAGPPPPAWRIVRGGGWNNRVEGDCHPANRAHDRPPDFVDTAIGFRLVARVRKAR